ncbi:MAG: hypothetical protein ACR2IQ_02795 [Minisyncoccia bacterium]
MTHTDKILAEFDEKFAKNGLVEEDIDNPYSSEIIKSFITQALKDQVNEIGEKIEKLQKYNGIYYIDEDTGIKIYTLDGGVTTTDIKNLLEEYK